MVPPLRWPLSSFVPGCTSGGLTPGFPASSSAAVRQPTMLNFAGFGRVIATEMDVDDLLQRDADSGQDGP